MDLLLNAMNNIFFSLNGCGYNDVDDVGSAANNVETAAITPWDITGYRVPVSEKSATTDHTISYDSTTNEYKLNGSAASFYLKKSSNNETYCFPLDDSVGQYKSQENGFRIVRSDPQNAEFPFLVENDTDLAPGIVLSHERLFIDTSLINYKSGLYGQNMKQELFIVGPWRLFTSTGTIATPNVPYAVTKITINSTGAIVIGGVWSSRGNPYPKEVDRGVISYNANGGPGGSPAYYLTPPGSSVASRDSLGLKKGGIYTFTLDTTVQGSNRFRIVTRRPKYDPSTGKLIPYPNDGRIYPLYAETGPSSGPGAIANAITPGPTTAYSNSLKIDTNKIEYETGQTEMQIFLVGPVTSSGDAPSSGRFVTWPFKINAAGTS